MSKISAPVPSSVLQRVNDILESEFNMHPWTENFLADWGLQVTDTDEQITGYIKDYLEACAEEEREARQFSKLFDQDNQNELESYYRETGLL